VKCKARWLLAAWRGVAFEIDHMLGSKVQLFVPNVNFGTNSQKSLYFVQSLKKDCVYRKQGLDLMVTQVNCFAQCRGRNLD